MCALTRATVLDGGGCQSAGGGIVGPSGLSYNKDNHADLADRASSYSNLPVMKGIFGRFRSSARGNRNSLRLGRNKDGSMQVVVNSAAMLEYNVSGCGRGAADSDEQAAAGLFPQMEPGYTGIRRIRTRKTGDDN